MLKEILAHHIREEEHGIFEEPGEHFTDKQRAAMGADFVAGMQTLRAADGGSRRAA